MKILNRKQFLAMPKNTVFFDYRPHISGCLSIKTSGESDAETDNVGDFCRCDIDAVSGMGKKDSGTSSMSSEESMELCERATYEGEQVDFYVDSSGRDGMYEEDAMFAVLDPDDVRRLISALSSCLPKP